MPAKKKRAPAPAPDAPRTGARRMAEIPPAVLRELNAGRMETANLVEWLAVDCVTLARHAAEDAGLPDAAAKGLVARARALAAEGIQARMKGMGAGLHAAIAASRRREALYEAFASHPSDMIRAWSAYAVAADPTLDLAERLQRARPFAADAHMAVRECAWDSFRDYLPPELGRGLALLAPWVADPDEGIRRCAIEATRPRGVWTRHIEALKRDPEPARPLLDAVRADPSRYVQNAAGNWLNDASKTRPEWVTAVCERWSAAGDSPHTAYIVRRGLRTLRKAAAADA